MARSAIDIIIPFYGHYAQVRECVENILQHTAIEPYSIHLVDDGSKGASFLSDIQKTGLVFVHKSPEQLGFGAALKIGFDASSSPWVVFLNSDCIPQHSHWLNYLRKSMETLKSSGVKLVSARMNHGGTGTFPECLISKNGEDFVDDIVADQPLPLICCLVNRQLFNVIGGFIKPYKYGWYEDEELFWRMKYHGFTQAVCGSSWIKHLGGLTVNGLSKDAQKIMEANKTEFLKDVKWGKITRKD